jgi:bacterioferritin
VFDSVQTATRLKRNVEIANIALAGTYPHAVDLSTGPTSMTESTHLSSESAIALLAVQALDERQSLLQSLNEVLGAELVCSLRRRNRLALLHISAGAEKAATTDCELRPDFGLANRLAERITRLGGRPEFALGVLDQSALDPPESSVSIESQFFKHLASERAAAALHRRLLARLGISDPGTSRVLGKLLLANEKQLSSLCELRWPNQGQQNDPTLWTITASSI